MSQAKELEPAEQGVAEIDFNNVWNQLSNMRFPDFQGGYRFAYMAGRIAGKNDAIHKLITAAESLKENQ